MELLNVLAIGSADLLRIHKGIHTDSSLTRTLPKHIWKSAEQNTNMVLHRATSPLLDSIFVPIFCSFKTLDISFSSSIQCCYFFCQSFVLIVFWSRLWLTWNFFLFYRLPKVDVSQTSKSRATTEGVGSVRSLWCSTSETAEKISSLHIVARSSDVCRWFWSA